ncbi:SGNH/GDSL hydrolase family protein [Tepidimonas ignava]|uniref:SGNH/GDSL hydrolase family protein n=1 Tax=Tepidimonas ignava TaxID=114249 RepID=UPI002FD8F13E
MRRGLWTVPALLAALGLVGCLGGGSDITAVRVAGDSLADAGTFGFKFTVQATSPSRTRIWADAVADAADVDPLCPRYAGDPTTGQVALRANAASCTSFAVGGGRINVRGTSGDATPYAIPQQLRDMAAAGYGARDIVLVDGGGNDLADLVGAFLAAGSDGASSYTALLSELLSPDQVGSAAAAGSAGLVHAGGLYMAALADRLVDTIQTQVLDKGARRVVVINAPDVTRTPRFAAVLAAVSASAGEQAAAQVVVAARAWLDAFNGRLAQRLAGNSQVALVDFRGELDKWLNNPSAYGLTNTTTPACPATGTDAQGLPTYNLATCTEAVLAAQPPAGASGTWWNTYVFSDNFHGTPRTNELMGALVTQTLVARGWL